jgi:HTH-type transcriptional regulator/antitoxin HigA
MGTRRPAEVFAPGEFLRDELAERCWTQRDLAEILDRPVAAVNEIVAGKRRITPDTARGLAAALGTSPEFWLSLEAAYQLWRVSADETSSVTRRAQLYAKAPVREMLRRGWIERSDSVDVLEHRVLAFLGVAHIDDEPRVFRHAARKSTPYLDCTSSQMAWLLRARQLAQATEVARYSRRGVAACLKQLRALIHAPEEARRAPRVLADAGIRLVIVEPLPGTKIDGATYWLDDSSPAIALSLRYDRLDSFWFTMFHELHHVSSKVDALDIDLLEPDAEASKPAAEREADRFASEQLIPGESLADFTARVRPLYSAQRIEAFARRMQVHPAIVVGQLQYRHEIPWSSFRKLLVPIREQVTASTLTDGWGTVLPADLQTL